MNVNVHLHAFWCFKQHTELTSMCHVNKVRVQFLFTQVQYSNIVKLIPLSSNIIDKQFITFNINILGLELECFTSTLHKRKALLTWQRFVSFLTLQMALKRCCLIRMPHWSILNIKTEKSFLTKSLIFVKC